MYKVIFFDQDDTLCPAKCRADHEMIELLEKLLEKYKVVITSWWMFENIENQIISQFSSKVNLNNLFLFPTNAAKMFSYSDWVWVEKYAMNLLEEEINVITNILEKAIDDLDLRPKETWWDIVENRWWSQITYSALGQKAPLEIKRTWDPDKSIRLKIRDYIKDELSDFNIWVAWTTSVDIMKKWIDKSYGVYKMMDLYNIKPTGILYVGDALFEWWNDFVVVKTWINTKKIENPEDTKKIIKELLV